jgi:arginine/ornithine transport system permease protein
MKFDLVLKHWDLFASGVWVTLHLTALALFFGMLIALPASLSLARRTRFSPLVRGYVYVFRGTPLLVQTYLIYYGLSQFEMVRDSFAWPVLREAWWCALIAFSLNSGAYTAEILRGAIKTTPKGEIEGAMAVGLSKRQVTWLVLLPSAMRRALPQYGNEVVFMLHGTVVASVITIQDILGVGRTVNAKHPDGGGALHDHHLPAGPPVPPGREPLPEAPEHCRSQNRKDPRQNHNRNRRCAPDAVGHGPVSNTWRLDADRIC